MLKTLKQGSSGDIVKVAQYLTGYAEIGQATGKYDANFVAFMCTWQREHGLSPDGIIGKNTWTKLAEVMPVCSTSKNRKSTQTNALQILLGVDADGIFGNKTKAAVAAYQSANGLTADGIVGKNSWSTLISGQTSESWKKINSCVHYLQWDSRWKKVKYSAHTNAQTIGNSGCGITAMAQILATWIDSDITPVDLVDVSVSNGFRTYNSGTAWGFFPFIFKKYSGFSKYIATSSVETLKAALRDGALAVCSMNNGDGHFWTKSGHFITAIGVDSNGYIYANDPNKSAAPRKQLDTKFAKCMKQAFIFWR